MCVATFAAGMAVLDTFDANVLNFERHKWGGVRHSSIEYGALDL